MKKSATKVLFVCSDNIGRSLMAEYLLKDYLRKNNRSDIEVSSCGTNANSDISSFCMDHISKLKKMGIDTAEHKRTQLTKDILLGNDVVIAMDETHQTYIKEKYSINVPLYNEVYKGEKTSIRITPPGATGPISKRLLETVDYINESLPALVVAIDSMNS
jgi:protein-tyrosine-phosphatase